MKTLAVVQADMDTSRLPGSTMRQILGRPMLWHILHRVKAVQGVDEVVVSTSDQPIDNPIRLFCHQNGIRVFSGSKSDILDRIYRTAEKFWGDPIMVVAGNHPFADTKLAERLLDLHKSEKYDFISLATGGKAAFLNGGRFPEGLDVECYTRTALQQAWEQAKEPCDRSNPSFFFWRNNEAFHVGAVRSDRDYARLRWTIDCESDFDFISHLYKALYVERGYFGISDIFKYLSDHPELAAAGPHFFGKNSRGELHMQEQQIAA